MEYKNYAKVHSIGKKINNEKGKTSQFYFYFKITKFIKSA
jgi:hypothetical protein